MANPLEQVLNRVKQILSPTASSAMSAAKQGYSNLKGNVQALSNPQSRQELIKGLQYSGNKVLTTPLPQSMQGLAQNVGKLAFRLQPIARPASKFLEGYGEIGTMGLVDVPAPKSTNIIDKTAYAVGGLTGLVTSPLNKLGAMAKLDQVGAGATRKLLTKVAPAAKNILTQKIIPAIGAETAQSIGYGLAATGAGVAGLRPGYDLTAKNLAIDTAMGLGFRGLGNAVPRGLAKGARAKEMHPEDVAAVDAVIDALKSKKDVNNARITLDRLAEYYVPKATIDELRNKAKTLPAKDLAVAKYMQKMAGQISPDWNGYQLGIKGVDQSTAPKVETPNLTQQVAENITGKKLRVRPSPIVEAPSIKALTEPDLTGASVSPETSSYLKELNQSQVNARQGKSNTASTILMDVKRKLVDSVSPIEDIFASNKRSGITVKPSQDFSSAVDRSKRATVLATQFVKDNGLEDVVRKAPDINALDQYLIAKHAAEITTKTGRNTIKDKQLVSELAPVYEPFAQQVRGYTRSLLDYATEAGLVSKENNALLKQKYPDYVPLNRIFAEGELNQKGFGAGPASISKQTVVQKLKGSEREIQSPLSSLLVKTEDAFKQGERNKAGTILANNKDVGGFKGLITPLRTAENVTKRISLYEEAKDLKPVQNKLSRMMMASGRRVRELKSAINTLERKGLNLSLKEEAPIKSTPLTSAIETKTTPNRVMFGTGENADVVVGGKPGKTTLTDKYATSTNRGKQSTKSFIEDLITEPNSDIQALKKRVATRENKLGPLFDRLQEIQDMYTSVKSQRTQMFDEAALLRDAESRGKSIFSIFRNGIKEIYETTPEIAAAAKSLDATQLGVVGEVLAAPVRIARVGITGINAPFVLANVAKDQVTSAINSDKSLQTSVLNAPNFVKALWAALGHGKEYDNWVRSGGGGTSFDIARNAPELSLNRMRAQRNIGSKALYTVTHPKEMLRAVENALARGEELTRIQQFTGTRDALLKQGMPLVDANAAAAKQSRTSSVNFARSGDWGRTLNSVWLYLNAGIQGGRTLASSLRDRPAQTITKLALVGMTPVAMTTLWNTSDPERKAAYDDIQDYEKDNNLIIVPNNPVKDPTTGKWNVIKVPLSQEVANLTIPLRHQLESMSGAPGTNFAEVAASLVGTFTGANLSSPNALLSQTTPQALKPGLQFGLNKNLFTGNDIVPQYMIDQGLPPEMQVKDNTSGTARLVGKAINQSPLKVEQAVKDVFGGVGNQLINASDTALNKAGVIPEDQIGGQSIPEGVVARFNQASGGQQLNNLYEGKPVTGGLVGTAQASDGQALPPEIVENKGSYYVKIGNGVKSFDTPEEATLAVDKQKFKESDKNIDLIGDTVFRKSKDGNVTTMPKVNYDTLVTTQKMENAKLNDDYKTWMDLALVQAGNIQTQMQDPTLDDLEKGDLQQKLDALIRSAVKYQGQGGFKKPKKAKAPPKMQVAKFARPSFKMKRDTTKKSTIKTVASKKIAPPKIQVSRFKIKKA